MTEFNRTEDARSGMALGSDTAAAVAHQAEAWARAQRELLSGVEAMWTGWMQRQHEALDASTQSLTQICECRNLVDVVQLQQQWLTDAVRRTASNVSALANDAAALTWRVAHIDPTGNVSRQPAPPPRRQGAENKAPVHREAAE
jgi:hypothetical protein